jgi:hypothetical protein
MLQHHQALRSKVSWQRSLLPLLQQIAGGGCRRIPAARDVQNCAQLRCIVKLRCHCHSLMDPAQREDRRQRPLALGPRVRDLSLNQLRHGGASAVVEVRAGNVGEAQPTARFEERDPFAKALPAHEWRYSRRLPVEQPGERCPAHSRVVELVGCDIHDPRKWRRRTGGWVGLLGREQRAAASAGHSEL